MRTSTWRALGIAVGVVVISSGLSACLPVLGGQESFTLVGGGYGHGVGMSQYGARGRADAGQSAAQILGAYYQGTAITNTAPAGPRVKLLDAASTEVSVSSGALFGQADGGAPFLFALPGDRVVLRVSGTNVTAQQVSPISGTLVTVSNGAFRLTWDQGAAFSVSAAGRSYQWGSLVAKPRGNALQLTLDQMSMDQYLYGLGEVPASWPTEALRSQAIAGRTYAAYRLAYPQSSDFDLYASVIDQAFVGTTQTSGSSGPRWTQAVDSTSGQVLTYNGSTIQAFYSSSNGGSSENSEYVWSSALPYLRAIPDPWDQATGNTRFSWSQTYTPAELQSWLVRSRRPDIGPIASLSIGGNIGASGRVDKATVTLVGTAGSLTMTGNQFRSMINSSAPSSRELLSTKFSVAPAPHANVPEGHSDLISAWGAQHVVVSGWAADRDDVNAPLAIHVYVDGRFQAVGTADIARPDVAAATEYGAGHGYTFAIKAARKTTTVCVYAINVGDPAPNAQLGCTTIRR